MFKQLCLGTRPLFVLRGKTGTCEDLLEHVIVDKNNVTIDSNGGVYTIQQRLANLQQMYSKYT